MPEMISLCAHQYDKRDLSKGDRFHADQQFVPALKALGRAKLAPVIESAAAPAVDEIKQEANAPQSGRSNRRGAR